MYDFETLVDVVLKNRLELDRKGLMVLIQEKKKRVGAGYLTDQGALFLIAGELGVQLGDVVSADLTLKDMYVGANDITIVARVLATYPIMTYNKKNGDSGHYRRITLFDRNNVSKLTLWDDKGEDVERLGVGIDTPVRILNGYVKAGLDGKPNLNLGKRGRIEVVTDESLVSKLPDLNEVSKSIDQLANSQQVAAVEAIVSSELKTSKFVRNDGNQGSVTQFRISSKSGDKNLRVVLWDMANPPDLKIGNQVRISNVRIKEPSHGELELHGDPGSRIEISSRTPEGQAFMLAGLDEKNGTVTALVVDRERRVHEALVKENALEDLRYFHEGDWIEIVPDEELNNRMICRTKRAIKIPKKDKLPTQTLELLSTKLSEVRDAPGSVMVEAIALSKGVIHEVNLRDSSIVTKGELVVGDDTGEIKLIGCRDQAAKLKGIEPGERLRIIGVNPQISKMGVTTLQLSYSSRIVKIMDI
jgi:replication factor A1